MAYEFIHFSPLPLDLLFRATAGVNALLIFFHLKHARVPSRLLLSMSFTFLALACWLSAISVALPADQLYAAPVATLMSTVLITFNIVIFSASIIYLFKKELDNIDLLFVILPVVAIMISIYFYPYDFEYYSYGWGISDYKLSLFVMAPFIIPNIVYILNMTMTEVQKLGDDALKRKMKILLFGWMGSLLIWGVFATARILTGIPDLSVVAISVVFWVSQYPFLTARSESKKG